MRVVAAPPGVQRPDLSVGEGEAGHSEVQHGRGVGAGPPVSTLPQVHPYLERRALRHPFLAPAAGQVENLPRDGRDRQGEHQVLQPVRVRRHVRQLGPHPHQPTSSQLDLEPQAEPGHLVDGVDLHRCLPGLHQVRSGFLRAVDRYAGHPDGGRLELRRPVPPVPGAPQAGTAGPAGPGLGQHRDPYGFVDEVGGAGRHVGSGQRQRVVPRQLADIGTPVHDRRRPAAEHVQQHQHTLTSQRDQRVRGHGRTAVRRGCRCRHNATCRRLVRRRDRWPRR